MWTQLKPQYLLKERNRKSTEEALCTLQIKDNNQMKWQVSEVDKSGDKYICIGKKPIGKDAISCLKLGIFCSTEHKTWVHSQYTRRADFKPLFTSQLHYEQKWSPGNLPTWPLRSTGCMVMKHQVTGFLSRSAYPSWGPAGAPRGSIQPFMAPLLTASPYKAAK